MLCNSISSFPDKIDEQTFFQDIDLDHVSIMEHYNELIQQKKYNEANIFINQQSNVFGYYADFFNMLENRIYSLQDYLLNKRKKNPFVSSDEEPSVITSDAIWI